MWLLFGCLAVSFTLTNIILFIRGKDYRMMMVLGLVFTAFAFVGELSLLTHWISDQPIEIVIEVAPVMSRSLWTIGIVSTIFNFIPLLIDLYDENKRKQKS